MKLKDIRSEISRFFISLFKFFLRLFTLESPEQRSVSEAKYWADVREENGKVNQNLRHLEIRYKAEHRLWQAKEEFQSLQYKIRNAKTEKMILEKDIDRGFIDLETYERYAAQCIPDTPHRKMYEGMAGIAKEEITRRRQRIGELVEKYPFLVQSDATHATQMSRKTLTELADKLELQQHREAAKQELDIRSQQDKLRDFST